MRNEGFPLNVTGVGFSMLKLVYVVFATLFILRKLVFGRRHHLLLLHGFRGYKGNSMDPDQLAFYMGESFQDYS